MRWLTALPAAITAALIALAVMAAYGNRLLGGNAFNWGTLAIHVLVTLGWGYYAFVRGGVRQPARERAA